MSLSKTYQNDDLYDSRLPADHSSLNLSPSTHHHYTEYIPYYKAINSSNRFLFNGRCGCICGPSDDNPANICIWSILLIPTILFGIFVGPKLYDISFLLPLAYFFLFLITISFLCLTQCTDPGIIPKQRHPKNFSTPAYSPLEYAYASSPSAPPQPFSSTHQITPPPAPENIHATSNISTTITYSNNDDIQISPSNISNSPTQTSLSHHQPQAPAQQNLILPSKVTLNIKGELITFKYCPTCHIYKPPNCSHCQSCNTCTKEADHHCPFVGNCVSQRNYFFFLSFNCSVLVYMVLTLVSAGIFLTAARTDKRVNEETLKFIAIIAICFIGIVGLVLVCALCGFHTFLMCKQTTTRALLTKRKLEQNSGQLHPGSPDSAHNDEEITVQQIVQRDDNFDNLPRFYCNNVPEDVQNELDQCTTPDQYVLTWIKHHTFLLENSIGNIIKGRTYLWRRPESLLDLRKLVPLHK